MPEDSEFEPGQALYLRAFNALMHDRGYGGLGTPLPIPYLAISQYARDSGIPGDEFQLFHRMVRALDEEWLDHVRKKLPPPPAAPAR